MHICNSGLEIILKSTTLLILIKCIGGQEMLENARCNHYPNRGTCEDRGFITKWYYDRYAHRCREFYYGGCEGNDNRFDSFEECSRACKYESLDDPKKRCVLPHDPGTCAGNFERWYFDMRTRQCVCSWWSGCGGNSNMFYSYMHCMSVCGIFADNRTSVTKMTIRRCIHEPKHSKTMSPREGRQYRDLFARRSRLRYSRRFPGKRLRPMSVQNDQHRDDQLASRYHYLLHYSPSQQWKGFSNHFEHDPRQEYSIGMITHERDHLSEALKRVPTLQERQKRIGVSEAGYYGQSGESRGQISYSRAHEVSQSSQLMPHDSSIHSTVSSPEHLHAKDIEAYVQQLLTHERTRAQALRERDRIMQQRRDEYERAMMIYKQELQQYQQAVQSAQNRVPKERVDDMNQQQMSLQGQYLNLDQTNTFSNGSSLANVRTSEEVRSEKLKHRKLLNFEKLKRIEKNRKLLKKTSKSLQRMQQQQSYTLPGMTVQEQQHLHQTKQWEGNNQRNQFNLKYGQSHTFKSQRQQQTQLYQASSDSHEAGDQGRQITSESSKRILQPDDYQVTEQLAMSRIHISTEPGVGRNITNQSANEGSWHNNQMQPDAEHFPFGMIIAADRLPDDQDVRVAETISASPLSIEDFAQEKQTIAIEDYDDDENYAYDQQTADEDLRSAFLEHIPTDDAEERWALSIAVQPTSAESSISLSSDEQKLGTITTIPTAMKKSEMVPAVVKITPFQEDVRADEDHNVNILEGENQPGGNEDEKIMFWQEQT